MYGVTSVVGIEVPEPSGGSSVQGQGAILSSFSPSDWFKLLTEVPKYKQITPSVLSERLRMMAFISQKLVYKSFRRRIPEKIPHPTMCFSSLELVILIFSCML